MSIILMSASEIALFVAKQAKEKRLSLNLSQQTLSESAGISLSVLKKFEKTGKISFESLLKIAIPLNALNDFNVLFKSDPTQISSLDELIEDKTRKRGRQ